MPKILILLIALVFAGCGESSAPEAGSDDDAPSAAAGTAPEAASPEPGASAPAERLDAVLAAQPDEVRARYEHRHPKETLLFFGIEPGMTVLEGLPGRGWYTKILVDYLGEDGRIIGAAYDLDMYPLFSWASDEFLAEMTEWTETFEADAKEWAEDDELEVDAFHFGSMPGELAGTADAVFLARVLHNPARFQNAGDGPFLDELLAESYAILKPGGVLGIVQHEARDDMSDEFADGSHGYLKKDWVIEQVEAAGFEFVAESDVNANPKDQPAEDDRVWRLPPSYSGSGDDPEAKAALDEIGESNRMTLKFVKPE